MSQLSSLIFPNTFFSVIRRSLHILSLLQHSSGEKWNMTTLSNALSLEHNDAIVTEKHISTAIDWLKDNGFPVVTEKGARHIYLSRGLTRDEVFEILRHYIGFSVEETFISDTFGNYIDENPSTSLWMISRAYFAALEKRKVRILYHSESTPGSSEYVVHPYRWIFRDNALYLAGHREGRGLSLFRLNRFVSLSVLDDRFLDEEDVSDDFLSKSLGAFISDRVFRITLEFDASLKNRITEEFGRLDLSFSNGSDPVSQVSFDACDLLSVCRVVFPFGGRVVIREPKQARDEMKRLLDGNAKAMNGKF